MKKAPRTHILDRLHRGVVWTCIGLTIYGSFLLGRRVQRYFTVVKPRRDEEDMRMLREIVSYFSVLITLTKL